MKEFIVVGLLLVFYLYLSYKIHHLLLKVKLYIFILVAFIYLVATYYVFDPIIYIFDYLRTKNIYIEFGHANLLLIELIFVCLFIAIVNIIWVLVKRFKRINKP